MKRFPLSTLHNHISAPRSNFDMVDTDSESSHRALFVETNAASDLPERTLYRVVTRCCIRKVESIQPSIHASVSPLPRPGANHT